MPPQHHPCFSLGCQSQLHLLLPSKGGRRQPSWGGSNLSSAVAPRPHPDPLSLPPTPSGIASESFAAGER